MKKRQQKRKGFTLVEVLVVVVILGLLAALVVPRVVGRGEEAKRTAAAVQIREIEQALEMYRLDSSLYPSTAQGIEALVSKPSIPPEPRKYREGGYLRKLPADPWGSPFVYRRPGDHGEYDLFSLGADGEEGGDGPGKDITNWE
ncbi:MAG TPA: type II secretion system major pseudopilin GspG [Aminivibrio sp.]|jgi:general secretion pathway protein G|uniref:type II secretion system major pseudopilin GspG n=1 Tax=Aminivibrio sp. TaxID=1872489 RepID=UPI002B1EDEF9|nr:type II secretion system major pseudopilin GspG [Aminivibrio sp.]NCB14544.1 type II secretion system protein GspG [Synergistales bacterium]MEA4952839.1 type II secretion system major pseudopilin GspG [Aminivibrio sp.]HPF86105.1 type II secretion system major pseudopilin GspG [Aminivibrio sp.]HPK06782.1 type II secretion system major pseudopilin GspG [Aminivibrio sp.]HRX26290.1 type II secretion system major pseudopilin GspG [Aminivibrio sp.]